MKMQPMHWEKVPENHTFENSLQIQSMQGTQMTQQKTNKKMISFKKGINNLNRHFSEEGIKFYLMQTFNFTLKNFIKNLISENRCERSNFIGLSIKIPYGIQPYTGKGACIIQ